jgi:RNA polymerase sigma-70 factor (ECF subfamily)
MLDPEPLLARCRQGELAAFTELFAACEGRVYRLALTILGDPQDAEDAVQDVFLRVFRGIDGFRGGSAFTTWLTAIVVNTCRDKLRRRKVRRTFSLEWLHRQPCAQTPDIANTVDERWHKQSLWAAVQCLDEALRLPVILFYHEGFSADEVAQALKLPAQTVYSRLNTARKLLRAALCKEEAISEKESVLAVGKGLEWDADERGRTRSKVSDA